MNSTTYGKQIITTCILYPTIYHSIITPPSYSDILSIHEDLCTKSTSITTPLTDNKIGLLGLVVSTTMPTLPRHNHPTRALQPALPLDTGYHHWFCAKITSHIRGRPTLPPRQTRISHQILRSEHLWSNYPLVQHLRCHHLLWTVWQPLHPQCPHSIPHPTLKHTSIEWKIPELCSGWRRTHDRRVIMYRRVSHIYLCTKIPKLL